VSARLLDRYPQLYNLGQQNRFFKISVFVSWILTAVYHSIILFIGGNLFWLHMVQGDGLVANHWVWGTAMYGAVLLTVLGKASLVTNNWTKYHVAAIPGSMVIWVVFVAVYGTVAPKLGFSVEYFGVIPRLFSSPVFWIEMPTLAILCLARDFCWKFSKRLWRPEPYHHVQEIQKYNIQDYRPRYVFPSKTMRLQNVKLTCLSTAWSNSKKQFARSARCSACANSADTPSPRLMSRKHACSRPTTQQSTVAVTVR
jgi:phospholipid-transporting ATPase